MVFKSTGISSKQLIPGSFLFALISISDYFNFRSFQFQIISAPHPHQLRSPCADNG